MAQHIRLDERKEPKVFSVIRNLISRIALQETIGKMAVWEKRIFHGKTVMLLSEDYNPGGRAFSASPFNLEDEIWDKSKQVPGEFDLSKKVLLEIHMTNDFQLTDVYYPI